MSASRSRRSSWVLPSVALASALLLRCDTTKCPPNHYARFDQCVRASDEHDGGVDASAGDGGAYPDSGADAECGADAMWSAERCVPREIYVDSLEGDDRNVGTPQSPLKTFKQAMSVAVEGQIVNFNAREYSTERGDDFSIPIPVGVTLRTRPDATESARFEAGDVQSLTFAGRAKVERLRMHYFRSVNALSGAIDLEDVGFEFSSGSLSLGGNVQLNCERCEFVATAERTDPIILMRGMATAFLRQSLATASNPFGCETFPPFIHAAQATSLTLENLRLSGQFPIALYLVTSGQVRISSSTFEDTSCPSESLEESLRWQGSDDPGLQVGLFIDDSTFEGAVRIDGNANIMVRSSRFADEFFVNAARSGTYDLGRPAADGGGDRGNNFFHHLGVDGWDITVFASGNTWNPGEQDADANGHYPEGDSRSVAIGQISGLNFTLSGFVTIQF